MQVNPIILTGSMVELIPMETRHSEELYEAGRHTEIWAYTQGRILTR
jgi:hypothetical protein